jgi:glycosyltransferase involved in cell wall biosynthesis
VRDLTKRRSVAALGDVLDPNCFGGAPNQFFEAAKERGFAQAAWTVDVGTLRRERLKWNAGRVLRGRKPGGFQYSGAGRKAAIARIDRSLLETDVISFNQHVPPFEEVSDAGGTLSYYIDATYRQLFGAYGYGRTLSESLMSEALEYEVQAFRSAKWIVTWQPWAMRSLVNDYGIPAEKCISILPAPNFPVYPGVRPLPEGSPGRGRPFVIGFIGKDWRRKGLETIVKVARILKQMGWKVEIRAMGFAPEECPFRTEVDCQGFFGFERKRDSFGEFLHGCDVGCLFSSAEAMGLAILEFLAVGVPVAGFTVDGLNDVLPAEAGFRFSPDASPEHIASAFNEYLRDSGKQEAFRSNAIDFASMLNWERCIGEFEELWATRRVANPFRLWRGP